MPYIPHKEWEYGFGILSEILGEIEDGMVVECHRHTYIVQTGGIALQVLNGIAIGMEDIGILYYLPGLWRGTLHEVVVVGIDTCYHALAHPA